ncbi:MAG TPA: hypothetical protein VG890_01690 [Puia sp.]|nr:hypothetical protein [Puia sp.]
MDRIEILKEWLNQSPGDPFLCHALALEYIKKGDDEEAKKLFVEILTREPDYIGSYYHLAGLLERMGDREGALSWFEKGMKAAKRMNDLHAFTELCTAYENLIE